MSVGRQSQTIPIPIEFAHEPANRLESLESKGVQENKRVLESKSAPESESKRASSQVMGAIADTDIEFASDASEDITQPTLIKNSRNLAHLICNNVIRYPDRTAIIDKEGKPITYADIGNRIAFHQVILKEQGFKAGDHVLILCFPEGEFLTLMIALLASRISPVFIDPRIGYRRARKALKQTKINAIICDPKWQRFRFLIPELWKIKTFQLSKQGLATHDGKRIHLQFPLLPARVPFIVERCHPNDTALITYTSGTTGIPKGAKRTHDKLIAQFHIINKQCPPRDNEVGITFLPLATLHGLCLGITTVIPRLDLTELDEFDPAKTCDQINAHKVTCVGGSPFFIERLLDYVIALGLRLPSLSLIIVGSAGVPPALIDKMLLALPSAQLIACYGATEAEPIASADLNLFLREYHKLNKYHPKRGYLAGKVIDPVNVKVVDQYFNELGVNRIGEILVSGPQVQTHYMNPKVTHQLKYMDSEGVLWHRTGDKGCFDHRGNLWLTGRVGDEVSCRTKIGNVLLDPYPVEMAIDRIGGIYKSALIQFNPKYNPILFCELSYQIPSQSVLREISQTLRRMSSINCFVHFIDKIPVDNRHNSKIDRHQLRNKALSNKRRYLAHCYRGA